MKKANKKNTFLINLQKKIYINIRARLKLLKLIEKKKK